MEDHLNSSAKLHQLSIDFAVPSGGPPCFTVPSLCPPGKPLLSATLRPGETVS